MTFSREPRGVRGKVSGEKVRGLERRQAQQSLCGRSCWQDRRASRRSTRLRARGSRAQAGYFQRFREGCMKAALQTPGPRFLGRGSDGCEPSTACPSPAGSLRSGHSAARTEVRGLPRVGLRIPRAGAAPSPALRASHENAPLGEDGWDYKPKYFSLSTRFYNLKL